MNRWLAFSIGLTVVAFGASLALYPSRDQWPERVAIHWGIDGQPDGFASRDSLFGVWLGVPLLMAGWIGLTLLLPWLSPKTFAVEPFRGTYDYLMALVNAFFLYLHAVVLGGAWSPERSVTLVVAGVFLLFGLMGNVLGKVRRNFWMGIRTPWTLADDGVWNATHRHAAYVYTAAGVVGFIAALAGVNLVVLFVAFLAVALWPALYSLLEYKRREARGLLDAADAPLHAGSE